MAEQKRYLCVTATGKFLGIDVRKLEEDEEVVDWESLPSFPFDFAREVPLTRSLRLALDDFKILLVGGRRIIHGDNRWGPWTPSHKTYQLELDITGNEKKAGYVMTEIAGIPNPFGSHFSFAVEIKGDYYFLIYGSIIPSPEDDPFWVLRSGSGEWECLPAPPLPEEFGFVFRATWFLFQDKLFLLTLSSTSVNHELEDEFMEDEHVEDDFEGDDGAVEDDEFMEDDDQFVEGEPEDEHVEDERVGDVRVQLCSFDPGTKRWTQYNDDDKFMNSFGVIIAGERRFFSPRTEVLSVPGQQMQFHVFKFVSASLLFQKIKFFFNVFHMVKQNFCRKDSIKISLFRSSNFCLLEKFYISTDKRKISLILQVSVTATAPSCFHAPTLKNLT